MKPGIFSLLILSAIGFSSCQKDTVTPAVTQSPVSQKVTESTVGLSQDTVGGSIKGYLRLQLAEDAVNTDNILIDFNPLGKTTFNRNEDAPTLQGFGSVSLSSLSSDNVALAINTMPLTATGLTIGLKVGAKTTGIYKLNLTAIDAIPELFDIWLMDKYKKDSLDIRNNPGYAFNLYKADTASYGSHRFTLVLREHH
ncbi:MAG TPA: hypothetical protein VIM16_14890 [Mucilaginibacter sp.]|jgi:hypothetical protein